MLQYCLSRGLNVLCVQLRDIFVRYGKDFSLNRQKENEQTLRLKK